MNLNYIILFIHDPKKTWPITYTNLIYKVCTQYGPKTITTQQKSPKIQQRIRSYVQGENHDQRSNRKMYVITWWTL